MARARSVFFGLGLLWLSTHALAESSGTTTYPPNYFAQDIGAYSSLIYSQGAYLLMVGEARLAWAKANLVEAMAAHEWERTRLLTLFNNRLELELRNLRKEEFHLRRKAQAIEEKANTVAILNNGKTSPHVFQALRYLLQKAISAGDVLTVMKKPVGQLAVENFRPNRAKEVKPFAGKNLGQLFTYVMDNDLSLEPYGDAHLLLLEGLGQFGAIAEAKVANIRENMEQLRRGTLSLWHLPGDPAQPPQVNGIIVNPGNNTPPSPPNPGSRLPSPGDPALPFDAVLPVPTQFN